MTAETRTLKMHHKLLYDVIFRQAGTLAKAILEGVMNSIDAQATRCDIKLTNNSVEIADDGRGFQSRKEIEDWFEVFGQPHDESEKKIFGTFRMGRGQLFAYGENGWHTNKFMMTLDVKNKGLEYELSEVPKAFAGCNIVVALYKQLLPSEIAETERALELWVRFAQIPVTLNGVLLSKDPTKLQWTHETDEAYIRLEPGRKSLSVYNLGIHVLEMSDYILGTGGLIVSKQQLRVNFARNDIQSDCPVWKKIKPFVDSRAAETRKKKPTLTDAERARTIQRILDGTESLFASADMKLFKMVTGRNFSFAELVAYDAPESFSVGPLNDRRGDMLQRRRLAYVVTNETAELFRETQPDALLRKLMTLLQATTPGPDDHWTHQRYLKHLRKYAAVPFDKLVESLSADYRLADEDKLSPQTKLWLRLMRYNAHLLKQADDTGKERKIVIGESAAANGWTDGGTYIAINEAYLKGKSPTAGTIAEIGTLLAHEYCHTHPDTESHDHDQAFYECYHDLTRTKLGEFVDGCLSNLGAAARDAGRRLTKAQLRQADAVHEAQKVMS